MYALKNKWKSGNLVKILYSIKPKAYKCTIEQNVTIEMGFSE